MEIRVLQCDYCDNIIGSPEHYGDVPDFIICARIKMSDSSDSDIAQYPPTRYFCNNKCFDSFMKIIRDKYAFIEIISKSLYGGGK